MPDSKVDLLNYDPDRAAIPAPKAGLNLMDFDPDASISAPIEGNGLLSPDDLAALESGNYVPPVDPAKARAVSAAQAAKDAENTRRGLTGPLGAAKSAGSTLLGKGLLENVVALPYRAAASAAEWWGMKHGLTRDESRQAFDVAATAGHLGPLGLQGAFAVKGAKALEKYQRQGKAIQAVDPQTGQTFINYGALADPDNIADAVLSEAPGMTMDVALAASGVGAPAVAAKWGGRIGKVAHFAAKMGKSPAFHRNYARVAVGAWEEATSTLIKNNPGMKPQEAADIAAKATGLTTVLSLGFGSPMEAKIVEGWVESKAGKSLIGSIITNYAKEGLQEASEAAGENVAAKATFDPKRPWETVGANMLSEGVLGGFAGAGMAGATHRVGHGNDTLQTPTGPIAPPPADILPVATPTPAPEAPFAQANVPATPTPAGPEGPVTEVGRGPGQVPDMQASAPAEPVAGSTPAGSDRGQPSPEVAALEPPAPVSEQLAPEEIPDRLAKSFSPEGFAEWHQVMKDDPDSLGGRHLDPDRGILIAGGKDNPEEVFKAADGTNSFNIASHILEAVRAINMTPEPGREGRYVVIGAPASGKTYTAAQLAKDPGTKFAVSPGFIASQDPIGRSIALANAGNQSETLPTVIFTFNPDLPLLAERYAKRTESERRPVSVDKIASDWLEGPKKILDGYDKYKGKFNLQILDTSTQKTYLGESGVNHLNTLADILRGISHDEVKTAFQRAINSDHPEEKPDSGSSGQAASNPGGTVSGRGTGPEESAHGGSSSGEVAQGEKPNGHPEILKGAKALAERITEKRNRKVKPGEGLLDLAQPRLLKTEPTSLKGTRTGTLDGTTVNPYEEGWPNEKTDKPIHPRAQSILDKAMAEKDVETLGQILHPGNQGLRHQFEDKTDVALPKGWNATRAAIAKHFDESTNPVEKPASPGVGQDHPAYPYQQFGDYVVNRALEGDRLDNVGLRKRSNLFFKNQPAQKHLYDAVELGVNRHILAHPELYDVQKVDIKKVVKALESLVSKLPTQTHREAGANEYQQYSTPPFYSAVVAWAANVRKGDVVLEPSAGVGGLAVFPRLAGAKVLVNEFDRKLRARLLESMPGWKGVGVEDARFINAHMKKAGEAPSVVLMNPPFSSTSGNVQGKRDSAQGVKHIQSALDALTPGGRLVFIMGDMEGGAWGRWLADTRAKGEVTIQAIVKVDGKTYRKYGTSFDSVVVVVDKTPAAPDHTILKGEVANLEDLADILKGVRDERSTPATRIAGAPAEQSGGAAVETPGDRSVVKNDAPVASDPRGDPHLERPVVAQEPGLTTSGKPGGGRNPRTVRDGAEAVHGAAGVGPKAGSDGGVASVRTGKPGRVHADEPGGGSREVPQPVGTAEHPGGAGGKDVRTDHVAPTETKVTKGNAKREAAEESSDSVFSTYRPSKVAFPGSKPHLGDLVESQAMATVDLPDPRPTTKLHLPEGLIKSGALSDAQLEAIFYATQATNVVMDDGTRQGFLIGDGTGVGKGREIAGMIMSSINAGQGGGKAVWLSKNSDLFKDAMRDWTGVLGDPTMLNDLSKIKATEGGKGAKTVGPIPIEKGILFGTYATVTGVKGEVPGARKEQLKAWLGEDFDGVIVLDEAHLASNLGLARTSRGRAKPSQVATGMQEIQRMFPKARVVYVTATVASDPTQLAFLERLGLWGKGKPFTRPSELLAAVQNAGLAGMELVARDLKARGLYISRNLSYQGVSYRTLEHSLNVDQTHAYDIAATAWQKVLKNVHTIIDGLTDGHNSGKAKGAALSKFYGQQQAFFNSLLTSLTLPTAFGDMDKAIKAGNSVVIQLTETGEARQGRAIDEASQRAKDTGEDLDIASIDLSPKDILIGFLKTGFPVNALQEVEDENGNKSWVVVRDSEGNPIQDPEAVAKRDELIAEIATLKLPGSALDEILKQFGTDNVAEITGRKERRVFLPDGSARIEKRTDSQVDSDKSAFMGDEKRILIFSKAANTGASFHADNAATNRTKRVHFVLQGGWNAADAIQGLGRTHRTNQAQAPEYVLVTTDLGGHKRFTSTIARRISQLGALTKGQRQASASLFTEKDNLESPTALRALTSWYDHLMKSGATLPDGTTLSEAEFENATGLALRDNDGNPVLERPLMRKFLNRVLALPVQQQNAVFDSLAHMIDEQYIIDEQGGLLEKGLQNIPVEEAKVVEEDPFFKDPDTGAETIYQKIEANQKVKYQGFDKVNQGATGFEGFYQDPKRGIPFAVTKTRSEMSPDGKQTQHYKMVGPAVVAYRSNLDLAKLEKLDTTKAEFAWDAYKKEHGDTETNTFHMITGAMLNIWNRFPENLPMDVGRIKLSNGSVAMGRIIPNSRLSEVLGQIGADKALDSAQKAMRDLKAPDLMKAVLHEGKTVTLANGYKLIPIRRSGEYFAVLDGFPYQGAMQAVVKQYPGWRLEQFQGQYGTQYKVVIPNNPEALSSLGTYLKAAPVRALSEPKSGWVKPREGSRGEIADFLGGQQLYEKALKHMGLPNDATLGQISGVVLSKIRTTGSTVQVTAVKILNQFKELGKAFAQQMAKVLHGLNPFQGRAGEIGAIGDDVSSLLGKDSDKTHGWQDELSPAQREALKNVGATKTTPTLKERVAGWKQDLGKKMQQGIADQFAPIAALDQHAYVLARMTKASDGAVEALMLFGNLNLKDGVYDTNADGIGFIEVMQRLQGEQDRFLWWVAANRAEVLKGEGRENLFQASDISELKDLNQGKMQDGKSRQALYSQTLADFNRIGKSVLDIAEESETIDPDSRAVWEREFYVPFYRAIEGGVSGPNIAADKGLVAQYAFKRLKGGTGKLNNDLMHNVLMNWAHLISSAAKNRAAKATLESAEKMGAAALVHGSEKGAVWHLGYTEHKVEGESEPVLRHGRVYYTVSDPYVLDAIMALESTQFKGVIMKGLSKLKRAFTIGVTASPVFKIRNLMRDSIASVGISGISPNVFKNVGTGINIMRNKKGQEHASLLASGGIIRFGTMLEGNSSDHLQKLINAGVNKNTIVSTWEHAKDAIQKGIDAYNEVGDWSEGANRAALYRQLRAQGLSHGEAAFEARDMLDFSMGGTWQAVRFLTTVTPFLNARIQGAYKLGKGAKARPGRFTAMVLGIALASIALMLRYKDDEDWKAREDWDRDNYWWFKANGKAYRIPKPFEIGSIGTLAERSVESFVSDEMTRKRFMTRLGAVLTDTFALNPVPQGIRPVLDVYANNDPFTGRPIEGPNVERLEKAQRYSSGTSEVGKAVGKAGVLSPVQVDYLVRGYLGWLGTASLVTTNEISRPFMGEADRPARKLSDTLIVGAFAESLPSNYSRYTTEFYKQAKEIEEAFATLKAKEKEGDPKAAEKYAAEHEDKLGQHQGLAQVKKDLSAINEAIRNIETDRTMKPAEKRKQIDALNVERNSITKDVMASIGPKKK